MNCLVKLVFLTSLFFLVSNGLMADSSKGILQIGTPNNAPLASKSLPNDGFYPELIRALFKKVGYDVKIRFLPFKRIITMLKSGSLTGAAMVSYRKERTQFLIYPAKELYSIKIKVFGLKTGKSLKFKGLESLKGSTVGTFRGGFIEKELAKVGVKYDSVNTIEQNIGKLLLKRVDFIISPEISLMFLTKQKFSVAEQKKIIGYNPPYMIDKHYLAISKKYPDAKNISKAFDRGLKMIIKDGTFARIKAKY